MNNIDNINYSEDITDTLETNILTGHPDFDKIDLLAQDLLDDYSQTIWGRDE